jgi:hypothetical protein
MLRSAALKRAHSARQRATAARLDEQVDMRALDAEMNDAEVIAPQHHDRRLADRHVPIARAQPADALVDADRDVNRLARLQRRPLPVRRAGAWLPRPTDALLAAWLRLALATTKITGLVRPPDLLLHLTLQRPTHESHASTPVTERN